MSVDWISNPGTVAPAESEKSAQAFTLAANPARSISHEATSHSDVQQLVLEARKNVAYMATFGDKLLEVLGGASLRTCSEVQHQVSLLFGPAESAIQGAEDAWKLLQSRAADPEVAANVSHGTACSESQAASDLLDDAVSLSRGNTNEASAPAVVIHPVDVTSSRSREDEQELLQRAIHRVAAITGHAVVLTHSSESSSGNSGHSATGIGSSIIRSATPTAVSVREASQVHVTLAGTGVARIALQSAGRAKISRVAFFAIEEMSAGVADAWDSSSHGVFQRLSAWAMRVQAQVQAYRSQQAATIQSSSSFSLEDRQLLASACSVAAVEDFLLWVTSHDDLFRRSCAVIGTLLMADPSGGHLFPPLLRKISLGNGTLRRNMLAAAQGIQRAAYHPHAVPHDEWLLPCNDPATT